MSSIFLIGQQEELKTNIGVNGVRENELIVHRVFV